MDTKNLEDVLSLNGKEMVRSLQENKKQIFQIQYYDASAYNPKYIKQVFERLDSIKEKMKLKEKELVQEQIGIE